MLTPDEVLRDPKNREILVQIAAQLNMVQGALPPPDLLERYETLVPGATERLLALAERQTAHRMDLESVVTRHDVFRSKLGIWGGVIVTLGAEALAGMLIFAGHANLGAGFGGAWLVGLAAVFVYGSKSRRAEREHKFGEMMKQLQLPFMEKGQNE